MYVAVLGCGPAGLMAAHGTLMAAEAHNTELNLAVFSRKQKSPLYGAQYLHKPIPGMTVGAPRTINYTRKGTTDNYRRKVYGQMWDGTVSPEDLAVPHAGWNIRDTYEALWERYEPAINNVHLDPVAIGGILEGQSDIVINTIPRNMLCHHGHHFGAVEVIAAGDAPGLGIDIGKQYRCPDETVICNGEESPSWYRLSRIFGHTTVEWPKMDRIPPVGSASVVQKPLHHDCDCWPELVHAGRYGSWQKGVLSHEAFDKAYDVTADWINGGGRGAAEEETA